MKGNHMTLEFDAVSQNESFARVVVGAFFSQLNPTLEELADVKTAVSEAVTNAVVHAYDGRGGTIRIECYIADEQMQVLIADSGRGIEDIERAKQPFFTTGIPEERSGMGFTVMAAFMDDLSVQSVPGRGTTVRMHKQVEAIQKEAIVRESC